MVLWSTVIPRHLKPEPSHMAAVPTQQQSRDVSLLLLASNEVIGAHLVNQSNVSFKKLEMLVNNQSTNYSYPNQNHI